MTVMPHSRPRMSVCGLRMPPATPVHVTSTEQIWICSEQVVCLAPEELTRVTLQRLVEHFDLAKSEIFRQPIVPATPDDLPTSWQMWANERRPAHARQIVPR
jgi:hypothetical protein